MLFSLLSLVTGFGLVVALLLLKRLAPITLPPVELAVLALLLMGFASFFGVYLRVISLPRSILFYRLLNAAAWGYAVWALIFYILKDRIVSTAGPRLGRAPRSSRAASDTEVSSSRGKRLSSLIASPATLITLTGLAVFAAAFLAAHPPPDGFLYAFPRLKRLLIVFVEALVSILAIVVGVLALKRGKKLTSRPWRAFLRGFGIAVLILIPANLLDFSVSLAIRSAGGTAKDGFVFAAGYGLSNIVLIAAIVTGFRLSGDRQTPALPQQMIDAFGITRREGEIIEKLLEGKTDRQIAEELYISPRTVDTHMRTIFRKCGVNSRLRLTRLVSSYGELRNSH